MLDLGCKINLQIKDIFHLNHETDVQMKAGMLRYGDGAKAGIETGQGYYHESLPVLGILSLVFLSFSVPSLSHTLDVLSLRFQLIQYRY